MMEQMPNQIDWIGFKRMLRKFCSKRKKSRKLVRSLGDHDNNPISLYSSILNVYPLYITYDIFSMIITRYHQVKTPIKFFLV